MYVETYPICFLKQVNFHSIKISWQKQRESKTRTTWRLRSAKMPSEDHHTKWVQRKDGIATGAGVRKRQWGLYSWWADRCKRKGRSWLFFRLWKRFLTAFEEKISCDCNFGWFFFAVFPVCGRKSPLTRRYKMLPQTVKKWKVQLQVLQKRQ